MDFQHIRKLLSKHSCNIWTILKRYFWMILQCIVTWRLICKSSDSIFKNLENMGLSKSRQGNIYGIFRDNLGFYCFQRRDTTRSKENTSNNKHATT